MKKFNKIFIITTSSLLCLSNLTALSVNAVATLGWKNDETSVQMLAERGYDVADTANLLVWDNNSIGFFSNTSRISKLTVNPRQLRISTKISIEEIEEIVHSYYPTFSVKSTSRGVIEIFDYNALPLDRRMDTIEDAEELFNAISKLGEITSCEFYGDHISPTFGSILGYRYNLSLGDAQDVSAILQEYINEKGLDVNIEIQSGWSDNSQMCILNPIREMTSQEISKLYTDIYYDLELKPEVLYDLSASYTEPLNLCKIDGDSNTDGELGMADATLILQYLTNKDEYDLTEQGAYNADLDKDGITASDALVIQQMLAEKGEV